MTSDERLRFKASGRQKKSTFRVAVKDNRRVNEITEIKRGAVL